MLNAARSFITVPQRPSILKWKHGTRLVTLRVLTARYIAGLHHVTQEHVASTIHSIDGEDNVRDVYSGKEEVVRKGAHTASVHVVRRY